MKYMGSKTRIAKHILPIILKDRKDGQAWVEPFVGGGNMIDKVDGIRYGFDLNKYAIAGLVSIRDCLYDLPKNNSQFTEDMYKELRSNDDYNHKGYASFALSYGGKFMGGWCRGNKPNGEPRDYVREAYNNAVKQSPKLQGVTLYSCSYSDISIPDNSIIYCDPPYQNTTSYKDGFSHDGFWQWCRSMANKGHTVFISEYAAPSDFECVWEKEIASSLTANTGSKKGVERLFRVAK